MSGDILTLNGVCKKYPHFALEDVSFSLPRGYIMGFVGQNGAGKTTTIRCILGSTRLKAGSVTLFGMDSARNGVVVRERIGTVYDSLLYASHLRLGDVEKQLRGFYPRWDSKQYHAYAERFKLPKHTKIGKFSKGMQMKLMLAAALSHHAELLILDEPTSGLDPVARDELLDILSEYIADGEGSVLFSTHITGDVARIADYVTVLERGRVWYTGAKDDLMEHYAVVQRAEEFPAEITAHCIGLHQTTQGFAALLSSDDLAALPQDAVCEPATIDDILIYLAKESA